MAAIDNLVAQYDPEYISGEFENAVNTHKCRYFASNRSYMQIFKRLQRHGYFEGVDMSKCHNILCQTPLQTLIHGTHVCKDPSNPDAVIYIVPCCVSCNKTKNMPMVFIKAPSLQDTHCVAYQGIGGSNSDDDIEEVNVGMNALNVSDEKKDSRQFATVDAVYTLVVNFGCIICEEAQKVIKKRGISHLIRTIKHSNIDMDLRAVTRGCTYFPMLVQNRGNKYVLVGDGPDAVHYLNTFDAYPNPQRGHVHKQEVWKSQTARARPSQSQAHWASHDDEYFDTDDIESQLLVLLGAGLSVSAIGSSTSRQSHSSRGGDVSRDRDEPAPFTVKYWVSETGNKFHKRKGCYGANIPSDRQRVSAADKCNKCCD